MSGLPKVTKLVGAGLLTSDETSSPLTLLKSKALRNNVKKIQAHLLTQFCIKFSSSNSKLLQQATLDYRKPVIFHCQGMALGTRYGAAYDPWSRYWEEEKRMDSYGEISSHALSPADGRGITPRIGTV